MPNNQRRYAPLLAALRASDLLVRSPIGRLQPVNQLTFVTCCAKAILFSPRRTSI